MPAILEKAFLGALNCGNIGWGTLNDDAEARRALHKVFMKIVIRVQEMKRGTRVDLENIKKLWGGGAMDAREVRREIVEGTTRDTMGSVKRRFKDIIDREGDILPHDWLHVGSIRAFPCEPDG